MSKKSNSTHSSKSKRSTEKDLEQLKAEVASLRKSQNLEGENPFRISQQTSQKSESRKTALSATSLNVSLKETASARKVSIIASLGSRRSNEKETLSNERDAIDSLGKIEEEQEEEQNTDTEEIEGKIDNENAYLDSISETVVEDEVVGNFDAGLIHWEESEDFMDPFEEDVTEIDEEELEEQENIENVADVRGKEERGCTISEALETLGEEGEVKVEVVVGELTEGRKEIKQRVSRISIQDKIQKRPTIQSTTSFKKPNNGGKRLSRVSGTVDKSASTASTSDVASFMMSEASIMTAGTEIAKFRLRLREEIKKLHEMRPRASFVSMFTTTGMTDKRYRSAEHPTYQLSPLKVFSFEKVKPLIEKCVEVVLEAMPSYTPEKAESMAVSVAAEVRHNLALHVPKRYKIMTMAFIGEKKYQGFHADCRALWAREFDSLTFATAETTTYFIQVVCFAVYKD